MLTVIQPSTNNNPRKLDTRTSLLQRGLKSCHSTEEKDDLVDTNWQMTVAKLS
jgi:hypothetical protein